MDPLVYQKPKDGCCRRACRCLYNCFRSVPWASAVAVLVAAVGFALCMKGWGHVSSSLSDVGLQLGNYEKYVAIILGITVALDAVIILFSCCSTGATREYLCRGTGKMACCKRCCLRFFNVLFAALTYLSVAWNLALILIFMIILMLTLVMGELCSAGVTIADGVGFETSKFGLDFNLSTTTEIHHFCDETKPLTPDMALMFAGAIVMMFAQVQMLAVVCINFVRVGYEGRLAKEASRVRLSMPLMDDE